ncbi:MAG: hypothetical protein AABW51_03075 [Nanoarchaeota archaeon]
MIKQRYNIANNKVLDELYMALREESDRETREFCLVRESVIGYNEDKIYHVLNATVTLNFNNGMPPIEIVALNKHEVGNAQSKLESMTTPKIKFEKIQ